MKVLFTSCSITYRPPYPESTPPPDFSSMFLVLAPKTLPSRANVFLSPNALRFLESNSAPLLAWGVLCFVLFFNDNSRPNEIQVLNRRKGRVQWL